VAKLITLSRDGRCALCSCDLPSGEQAWWSPKRVVCVSCHDAAAPESPAAARNSARAEYERRSMRERARQEKAVADDAAWRDSVVEQHPVVGRIATFFTPRPSVVETQPTTAWATGAAGEERVAEVLADVAGIEVLHDRRVPGGRANIDHIVVGPAGVFVIDAKKYTGKVEAVDKGSFFHADWRLLVNGRDQTKLVDGVLRQIEVVRGVLGDELSAVPVHGVLCFVGAEWGIIMRSKTVKTVTALWPTKLPEHVTQEGAHSAVMGAIAVRLRDGLRPAV
jgi:hypothetical protein